MSASIVRPAPSVTTRQRWWRLSCALGILGLVNRHSAERVDAACAQALVLGTRSYSSVAAILNNRQEQRAVPEEPAMLMHENIRGPGYYH